MTMLQQLGVPIPDLIPQPDWAYGKITQEGPTWHWLSKFSLKVGISAGLSLLGARLGGFFRAPGETTVIGKIKDLENLGPGESTMLDRLPNQGSPKLNWQQNSGVLRSR